MVLFSFQNDKIGLTLEAPSVAVIESVIKGFLSYLESNRSKYFTSKNYFEADDNYLKNAS